MSISKNSDSTTFLGPSSPVYSHGESFSQIKSDFLLLQLLPVAPCPAPAHHPGAAVTFLGACPLPLLGAQTGSLVSPPTPSVPAPEVPLLCLLPSAHVCPGQRSQIRPWRRVAALECQRDGAAPSWDLAHTGMLVASSAIQVQCWIIFPLPSKQTHILCCFLDNHLQPVPLYEGGTQGHSLALSFAELHEVPFSLLKALRQHPCPPAYCLLPQLTALPS